MKVKLIYFKENGTYYAEGEYESEAAYPWDVYHEVRGMRSRGELPGLCKGSREWHILVKTDYVHDVPQLLPLEG